MRKCNNLYENINHKDEKIIYILLYACSRIISIVKGIKNGNKIKKEKLGKKLFWNFEKKRKNANFC